jgi:NAD(P)-dependent dehydrogenase (short-subunit alcohol dehydrogenase family)
VLLISVLFILLSAQLDVGAMLLLGWKGLLVAVGMVLLVRPLAVVVSVWPSHMDWRSRAVLALTSPRGIVAAAVASLSAIQLRQVAMDSEAAILEGLVYLVILVTGAWATAMAVILPPALGFQSDPSRRLTVLVGAGSLSEALAHKLRQEGRKVVVIDAVSRRLKPLKEIGLHTVRGDARDASTYENAGVERDTQVLAVTTNDELNVLAAELVREEFGVEHPVVAMQQPSEEFGRLRRAWMDLLGGRGVRVELWMSRLSSGKASLIDVDLAAEGAIPALRERITETDGEAVFICGWSGSQPSFRPKLDDLERFDRVTVLVAAGEPADDLAMFAPAAAADAGGEPGNDSAGG